jgi:hypothetical protein
VSAAIVKNIDWGGKILLLQQLRCYVDDNLKVTLLKRMQPVVKGRLCQCLHQHFERKADYKPN